MLLFVVVRVYGGGGVTGSTGLQKINFACFF